MNVLSIPFSQQYFKIPLIVSTDRFPSNATTRGELRSICSITCHRRRIQNQHLEIQL